MQHMKRRTLQPWGFLDIKEHIQEVIQKKIQIFDPFSIVKCDMITGNESDVRNIDFELQAKRGDKFLCFILLFNFKEVFISLQSNV